jgi:hypothetical protein
MSHLDKLSCKKIGFHTYEKGSLLSKQMHVAGEFYQSGVSYKLLVLVLISKN